MLVLGSGSVCAGVLPTEIYYNGPLAGADADEFLEITNTTDAAIPLSGFTFADGIGFTFPALTLAPGTSLVLAPDVDGFRTRFPDFSGGLVDVTGGLSNAGETVTLLDAAGETVFSVAYDDTAAWPAAADGSGASLELAGVGLPLSAPDSWLAAEPQPGSWRYLPRTAPDDSGEDDATAVPAPPALGLLAAGFLGLGLSRYRGHRTGHAAPDAAKL